MQVASAPDSIARHFASSADAPVVLVAGGDGTVNQAVNGLCLSRSKAALGVLPLGTGNDFAKACGLGVDWRHAAALLATCIRDGGKSRTVDVGTCNGRFFANGVGVGLDARVAAASEAIRLPLGQLVYLAGITKCVIEGLSSPAMHIRIDGEAAWDGPVTLANIANGPWLGGQFRIAPGALLDDHAFNIVIADTVSPRRIVPLVRKLMRGLHLDEPEIRSFVGQSIQIRSSEPVLAHLDGEIQDPADRFDIELLAGRLRLLSVEH